MNDTVSVSTDGKSHPGGGKVAWTMPGMTSTCHIRSATAADAPAISAIYNHYVMNDTCTYQEQAESVDERHAWLSDRARHGVVVAEQADGEVIGWASLSRFREKSAYRFTGEDTIYLRHDRRGCGIGTRLMAHIVEMGKDKGLHAIIAGISAEQVPSIALHRRFGFTEVARLREAGFKMGRWLDLIYMQVMVV